MPNAARQANLLAGLKGEGWYLARRLAPKVGTTIMCGGCDDECSAFEWYRHPGYDPGQDRMFAVCDGCGWSVEEGMGRFSNEREARLLLLAGLYARNGCHVCHELAKEARDSCDDEAFHHLAAHVEGRRHLDTIRKETYEGLVEGGLSEYDAWRIVYDGDDETEAY